MGVKRVEVYFYVQMPKSYMIRSELKSLELQNYINSGVPGLTFLLKSKHFNDSRPFHISHHMKKKQSNSPKILHATSLKHTFYSFFT